MQEGRESAGNVHRGDLGKISHQAPLAGGDLQQGEERKQPVSLRCFARKECPWFMEEKACAIAMESAWGSRSSAGLFWGHTHPTLPLLEGTGGKGHPQKHARMGTETFSKWQHGGSMPVNHSRHQQRKGRKKAAALTSCLTEIAIKE